MKKIYRSIAVTVLAALMALPMVVRAEDNRLLVKEIEVTGLKDPKDVRLYVGETYKNVLDRYANITFKAKLPDTNKYVDMELKAVGFYSQGQGYNAQRLKSDYVWPFDKTQDGLKLNKDKMKFKTVFTLAFKEPDLYDKYQFNSTDAENTELVFDNGTKKLSSSRTEISSQGGKNIELLHVPFDATIFRKFTFISEGAEVKKVGAGNFLKQCDADLPLEENRKVGICLKKEGEQNDNAAVEVKLLNGANKYAAFLRDFAENDKFLPNGTNIMTLGLDEKRMADALRTLFTVKADKDDKIPYIEAQDVTLKLKPDEKITAEKLIEKAVNKLTTDVLTNSAPVDKSKLSKVKALVKEANGGHHGFTEDDIATAKANGTNGLEIEYRFTSPEGDKLECFFSAKLFIEPVAAPNPPAPAPVPQPQPKQQEKTGNTYFDLGRNFLPTCPDSKCAKTETSAKKDDVPNTAAAANN